MKKKRLSLLLCLTILFIGVIGMNFELMGHAVATPTIDETIKVELKEGETSLPLIMNADGWVYTIDIFKFSDENLEEPIAIGVVSYKFTNIGKFRLRYNLRKADSKTTLNTIIFVEDTTLPEVLVSKAYKGKYANNDILEFQTPIIKDNDLEQIKQSIIITRDGKDVSKEIKNNKIKLKAGEYVLTQIATDRSGNVGKYEHRFIVEDGSNLALIISLSIVIPLVLIGAGVATFIIVKKRKQPTKKEEQNS